MYFTYRATSFAERLKLNIAVIHIDQNKEAEIDREDGRCSPPLHDTEEAGALSKPLREFLECSGFACFAALCIVYS